MTFQEQFEKAEKLKRAGLHEKASFLLDELANAILYNENYNKQDLNVALYCTKAIRRRLGAEVAAFAAMKIREDREQKITCSLSELVSDFADKQSYEQETDIFLSLARIVASNKKLMKALAKNASAQYINRILANNSDLSYLQGKGQKLKNFFKSNLNLFFE